MDETKVHTPWYRQPIGLGLVGLVLMVVGWNLSTFVSLTPRQAEQADRLAQMRALADDKLSERLDEYARHVQPPPPFRWSGRLLMLAGAGLFLVAAVQMFRQPAAPPPAPDLESEEAERWRMQPPSSEI